MSKISIVDDDLSVRRALQRLLKSAGYDVTVFDSSEAFLESDSVETTDFLVLDVHLPGLSGLELQRELISAHIACPNVFISAFDDEHARSKALEMGAVDFLGKPLDVDQLLSLIEKAIG